MLTITFFLVSFVFFCYSPCFSIWPQMTLSPQDFSLQFHPALSTDTAEYICLVNDRHSPEAIIDLLVQGKRPYSIYFIWKWQSNVQIKYLTRTMGASLWVLYTHFFFGYFHVQRDAYQDCCILFIEIKKKRKANVKGNEIVSYVNFN